MTEEKENVPSHSHQLHGYLITELQKSDERQWKQIEEHHSWLTETKIRIRLLKSGVIILATIAAAVGIWLRGGWDAIFQLILR